MSQDSKNSQPLGAKDRARMSRLYEEVQGRLTEMGLTACRVLEMDPKGAQFKFAAVSSDVASEERVLQYEGIEIVCGPNGCGCYNHDAGECFPC